MNTDHIQFSIIITVYDQAYDLQRNLPAYLTQVYEPGYEVIVVDEYSTDETPDTLKLLKNSYPQLYTTFLPKPEWFVRRHKQALNIGVKAAKNNWMIFADVNHQPVGDDILNTISELIHDDADVTLGHLRKKGIKLQTFDLYDAAADHIICHRYDFVIVRRQVVYDVLKYIGKKPSWSERISMKWRIWWKNLLSSYERITYLPKE